MFANQTPCDLKGPCIILSKLNTCTMNKVNLNIHSLETILELYKHLGPYVFNFLCFQKNFFFIKVMF